MLSTFVAGVAGRIGSLWGHALSSSESPERGRWRATRSERHDVAGLPCTEGCPAIDMNLGRSYSSWRLNVGQGDVLRIVLIRTSFGDRKLRAFEAPLVQQKLCSSGKRSCVLLRRGNEQPCTLRRFARHSNVAGRRQIIRVARQIGLGPKPDAPRRYCGTSKAFARSRARAVHDSAAVRIQHGPQAAEDQPPATKPTTARSATSCGSTTA
jgi:hypothetical protein